MSTENKPVVVNQVGQKSQINEIFPEGEHSDKVGQKSHLMTVSEVIGSIKTDENYFRIIKTSQLVKLAKIKSLYESGNIPLELESYGPTFKRFCQSTGMGWENVRKNIRLLNQFGEEIVRRLENLNIPFTTLRQVKRLPDDQRNQVTKFLMNGSADKDAVKAYITELSTENARLKETAGKEKIELAQTLEDTEKLVAFEKERAEDYKKETLIRRRQVEKYEEQLTGEAFVEQLRAMRNKYFTLRQMGSEDMNADLDLFEEILHEFSDAVKKRAI